MRKHLSFIIVCFVLLAVVGSAFHHHDDGADHPECTICASLHQQADSTCSFSPQLLLRTAVPTVYARPVLPVPAKNFFASANDRAPPA